MSIQTTARHAGHNRHYPDPLCSACFPCTHEDGPHGYIVYPGEISQDASGKVREDGMRLVCDGCGQVLDYSLGTAMQT